jgi:hypothetical protein
MNQFFGIGVVAGFLVMSVVLLLCTQGKRDTTKKQLGKKKVKGQRFKEKDCTQECLEHCFGETCNEENPSCAFCGGICDFVCDGGLQEWIKDTFVDEMPTDQVVAMDACSKLVLQDQIDECVTCEKPDDIVCRRLCLNICGCLQAMQGGTQTDYYQKYCYKGTDPLPAPCGGHGVYDANSNSCVCDPGYVFCNTGDSMAQCCALDIPCSKLCPMPPGINCINASCETAPCPCHEYCQCISGLTQKCVWTDDGQSYTGADNRPEIEIFCKYCADSPGCNIPPSVGAKMTQHSRPFLESSECKKS